MPLISFLFWVHKIVYIYYTHYIQKLDVLEKCLWAWGILDENVVAKKNQNQKTTPTPPKNHTHKINKDI